MTVVLLGCIFLVRRRRGLGGHPALRPRRVTRDPDRPWALPLRGRHPGRDPADRQAAPRAAQRDPCAGRCPDGNSAAGIRRSRHVRRGLLHGRGPDPVQDAVLRPSGRRAGPARTRPVRGGRARAHGDRLRFPARRDPRLHHLLHRALREPAVCRRHGDHAGAGRHARVLPGALRPPPTRPHHRLRGRARGVGVVLQPEDAAGAGRVWSRWASSSPRCADRPASSSA